LKQNGGASSQPIEYNLETTKNLAFTTTNWEVFSDTIVEYVIGKAFSNITSDKDTYMSREIDEILLSKYRYKTIKIMSYIPLFSAIFYNESIVNPTNNDRCCSKWNILSKPVLDGNNSCLRIMYTLYENKYKFNGLKFPTLMSDIMIFQKTNSNVSVNV